MDSEGQSPEEASILMTIPGYLILIKPFDDDLSWELQRKLVDFQLFQKELLSLLPDASPSDRDAFQAEMQRIFYRDIWQMLCRVNLSPVEHSET